MRRFQVSFRSVDPTPAAAVAWRCVAGPLRSLWTVAGTEGSVASTKTEFEAGGGRASSSRVPPRPGGWSMSCTEFEYGQDDAFRRHLPKPGPGGFTRGNFIGWRRADRYGPARSLSVHDLYELLEPLGQGGFGTVHAARHRRTGEAVAIKSVPKDRVGYAETLQLEVEFLKVADHPNVIRYYEAFEDSEHLHLIMELCSGGPLSEHIKAAHDCHGLGINESDLARIMLQLLRSVAYCHAHSIVHRDLKPHNFIFGCGAPQGQSIIPIACCGTADAPLKLVDFGVSGVVRTDRPEKRWLTKRAGTDGYMAPEVLEGCLYGPPADLFSLGAVLHTMIAGKPPRWENDRRAYSFPGSMRWHSLSPEGKAFLERLLERDPTARPTASEALQDPWFQAVGVFVPEDISKLQDECISNVRQFAHRSKLQRSIMYSMVAFAPLHNHYMEQLRVAFLACNRGASGAVSWEEFSEVVHGRNNGVQSRNALASDEESPEKLFSMVNSSQSGQISYSEWLTAAAPQAWYDQHDPARRAFDTLDVDRNGFLVATDLCQVLPGVFQDAEIDEEIRCLTPSGNGRLTFKDFCALSGHTSAQVGT